ncbi:M56 family metallopeptidase [Nesterenkonia sp. NBAIMH1]|uniref:M56 family metallopeptidase n=1 Tax=Nesterenkonia sp. NBAIMH1 TaxID=2600320 RepID=UPI0011B70B85|nr:M56 family metallopeptidase [Nesterenkonia sp. NBAIMH1]
MSSLTLALLMVGVVLATACLGSPLIRAAAPTLMRFPRLAVISLGASLMLWMASVIAAGLFLAWSLTGPSPLPEPMAEVCRRCLDASNPFSSGMAAESAVPSVVFLAAPALAVAVVAAVGLRSVLTRRRRLRGTCRSLLPSGRRETIGGRTVTVVADPQPSAFALGRGCGIVVSTGLLEALSAPEAEAVVEHEAAHVRERHHLILDVIESLTGPLRWIPFAAAIADSVPHYLEISADRAAQRRVGTRPLASALLTMGQDSHERRSAARHLGPDRMMLASGPERVRQLVRPADPRRGALGAAAIVALMTVLIVTSSAAHGAALAAVLSGCVL